MSQNFYEEYIKETEPDKQYKSYLWATAIGLQKVDNLQTSDFLNEVARENIEGIINFEQVQQRVNKYYCSDENKSEKIYTEEGDKVSTNIVKVLAEQAFSLTPNEYISIHRKLFDGILDSAGKIRNYNIKKEEWVLSGKSVIYGTASELKTTLEYDITQEKMFKYDNLSIEDIIKHLAEFISKLWQIHIFEEGNTRTTSVFLIKYLRTLGYNVSNDIFAQNARYFRNALVRANYSDLKLRINKTTEYLENFLRNLLIQEKNELKSRYLHIDKNFVKYLLEQEKNKKPDIQKEKPDIQNLSDINISHLHKMFEKYKTDVVFGRTDVEKLLYLKPSRTSELLKLFLNKGFIEQVKGFGKGKYKFSKNINFK